MTPEIKSGKVMGLVTNFESNFNINRPNSDQISGPDSNFADRGEVVLVRDAFEVLMQRSEGDTLRKTPARKVKRLVKLKGSPAQDIRNWARRKPGGSRDQI